MAGNPVISAEPDIRKIIKLHRDWRAAIAGSPVAAAPILERVRRTLPAGSVAVDVVKAAFSNAMRSYWEEQTEASYLFPHGETTATFGNSRARLGKRLFREIDEQRATYRAGSDFIIGGFDTQGVGYVLRANASDLSISDHSIIGYTAIGSGSPGADFMMKYKDVGPRMPTLAVLYYAIEGKYFGELAYGVGTKTDARILRFDKRAVCLGPNLIDNKIIKPICWKLQPKQLRDKDAKRIVRIKKLSGL
jgi:hypothetical protein